MYKISLLLILLFTFLNASTKTVLCFTSMLNSTFCPKEQNSTVVLSDIENIENSIYTIQSVIRKKIDDNNTLILLAENFEATLLAIAQVNLLPYYRKSIKGLVLKKPIDFIAENNETEEYKSALSIPKQMDWYWTRSVILESNRTRRDILRKAFERDGIKYRFFLENTHLNLKKWFPSKLKCKVEPKKELIEKPSYYGAILHLHLGKILYKSKSALVHQSSQNRYDFFYKEKSEKNPIFIYIHSEKGLGLSKQYADRGYGSISVNTASLESEDITLQEKIEEIKKIIKKIIDKRRIYVGDREKVVLMTDSKNALLSYMALTQLPKKYQPRRVIFNSLATDLSFFSKEKQGILSGIDTDINRTEWIENFSPLSPENLDRYIPSTLVIQSLDDTIVIPKHLEELEIHSVIHNNNIRSLWIKKSLHNIAPNIDSLQPSYLDIETKIDSFIQ